MCNIRLEPNVSFTFMFRSKQLSIFWINAFFCNSANKYVTFNVLTNKIKYYVPVLNRYKIDLNIPVADLIGGARDASPRGQNSFIFMQFSAEKIGLHTHLGSWRPPWGKSWIHHCIPYLYLYVLVGFCLLLGHVPYESCSQSTLSGLGQFSSRSSGQIRGRGVKKH